MHGSYTIGDLVHIPQAVDLLGCHNGAFDDLQLTIPYRIFQTRAPKIGVVTEVSKGGYLRVFCEGAHWSVALRSVYHLDKSRPGTDQVV